MSISTAARSTAPPRKKAALELPVAPEDLLRLSVKQYHQMIDASILLEGDPIELLEGWLVTKMPKKPAHRVVNRAILRHLDLDRGIKKRIYARENIPIYWIVNLVDMTIEVYTGPTGKGKKSHLAPARITASKTKSPSLSTASR